MVRIVTFVGLCAGTYVGVKALDNLFVWMAERREANAENFRIDREAAQLKRQLLREIQEKQATTLDKGLDKHHIHLDKDYEISFKYLKQQYDSKLLNRHREDKLQKVPAKHQEQPDDPKLVKRQQEHEHRELPDKLMKEQHDQKPIISQLENCPGEVHAECLECGETFQIVEPVPHIRKPDSPANMI